MFKFNTSTSATDLSVMRILISGGLLFFHHILKDSLFMENSIKYFKPIGVFKLLSQPISAHHLEIIYVCWVVVCIMILLGLFYRLLAPIWFLLNVVVLGYVSNFGSISNSTQLILLASLILSLSPCSDRLSIDSFIFKKITRHPWHYFWPKLTLQLLVTLSMCTLGIQKLYFQGFEWALSDKLYLTIFVNPEQTNIGAWILSQPVWISQLLAIYVLIAVELFAPLALFKPFNYIYPLMWASLHIGISFVLGGFQIFFLQIPVYMCFYNFNFLDFDRKKSVQG